MDNDVNNDPEIIKLSEKITDGWLMYKRFLDAGDRQNPLAVHLKSTIDALEFKRGKLQMLFGNSDVIDFIRENGGSNG